MDNRPLVFVVALAHPACIANGESPGNQGLPFVAARVLAISPGTNYVAGFDIRQLQRDPAARAAAAGGSGFGWRSWAAPAELLQLDPFADASSIAVTAAVGSCGVTDSFVFAVPSTDPTRLATRVDAAIDAWRRQHPPVTDDGETGEPLDPALSRWVPVADGACTILQVGSYGDEQVGVTLRYDGVLFVHSTPFGRACQPIAQREPDLTPEITDLTLLTGDAFARSWQARPGAATPAVIEAMPGGSEVTWVGDHVDSERFDFDRGPDPSP